jgi:hypothetical protein
MTKSKYDEPIQHRYSNDELKRLLAIQAGMLQNSMRTSDLLRWEMLRHGLVIDRPPEICDPETGAEPPDLETVIKFRELAEEESQYKQDDPPLPQSKVRNVPKIGGRADEDKRKDEEMEDDEIIKVPAVSDMAEGDFRKHCELRHRVNMNEARHTVQHAAGLSPDHIHKPDAMHRRMARAADIRTGTIEPSTKETMYLTGQDEWGDVNA